MAQWQLTAGCHYYALASEAQPSLLVIRPALASALPLSSCLTLELASHLFLAQFGVWRCKVTTVTPVHTLPQRIRCRDRTWWGHPQLTAVGYGCYCCTNKEISQGGWSKKGKWIHSLLTSPQGPNLQDLKHRKEGKEQLWNSHARRSEELSTEVRCRQQGKAPWSKSA